MTTIQHTTTEAVADKKRTVEQAEANTLLLDEDAKSDKKEDGLPHEEKADTTKEDDIEEDLGCCQLKEGFEDVSNELQCDSIDDEMSSSDAAATTANATTASAEGTAETVKSRVSRRSWWKLWGTPAETTA